ncbi:hypothetical protein FIBSPDRAFT_891974 [Athelia psychrophila]|uniref:Uncharacterized protein n=1 Tax=Athelia psychrophila TaxID=1759441 RepID=A0A166J383_9AGAM|nr:hypothetical protein FIBSPDRAFT_891974 [Fibularhizoctonia sp. CBS 109695]
MSIDGLVAHQAPSLSHQSQSYTYEHPFGLASPRDRRVRENIGSRAVEGVLLLLLLNTISFIPLSMGTVGAVIQSSSFKLDDFSLGERTPNRASSRSPNPISRAAIVELRRESCKESKVQEHRSGTRCTWICDIGRQHVRSDIGRENDVGVGSKRTIHSVFRGGDEGQRPEGAPQCSLWFPCAILFLRRPPALRPCHE